MTVIRPTGSVSSAVGAQATGPLDAVGVKDISESKGVTGTQAVLADLRAGKVGADEAVRRLTELAIRGAGTPESLRPVVEARIRAALARDPFAGALLRRLGAKVSDE